jgi:hypothetical protein
MSKSGRLGASHDGMIPYLNGNANKITFFRGISVKSAIQTTMTDPAAQLSETIPTPAVLSNETEMDGFIDGNSKTMSHRTASPPRHGLAMAADRA